jgi:hypothetical protein
VDRTERTAPSGDELQDPDVRSTALNPGRFVAAALAAGAWVFVSGLLMAAAFGYRDMKAAFDTVGLPIPQGLAPFITHTLVRLSLGAVVVVLYALTASVMSKRRAVLAAGGVVWFTGMVLPYAVVSQWGLFGWAVAAKLWAWSAAELFIAALIAGVLYRPRAAAPGSGR